MPQTTLTGGTVPDIEYFFWCKGCKKGFLEKSGLGKHEKTCRAVKRAAGSLQEPPLKALKLAAGSGAAGSGAASSGDPGAANSGDAAPGPPPPKPPRADGRKQNQGARHRKRRPTEDKHAMVEQYHKMREEGWSQRAVADKLRVSQSQLSTWSKELADGRLSLAYYHKRKTASNSNLERRVGQYADGPGIAAVEAKVAEQVANMRMKKWTVRRRTFSKLAMRTGDRFLCNADR